MWNIRDFIFGDRQEIEEARERRKWLRNENQFIEFCKLIGFWVILMAALAVFAFIFNGCQWRFSGSY